MYAFLRPACGGSVYNKLACGGGGFDAQLDFRFPAAMDWDRGADRRGSDPQVEPSHVVNNDNYGLEVLNHLHNFRQEGLFTDTILCAGEEEFPCHRNVLAVSSPYFKAMFSSDLRESREVRIPINEVSAGALEKIINYAYTGKLEITTDNAQEMMGAAGLLQYPAVVQACCEFLAQHLHPANCLGIEDFAHLHSCCDLEAMAHKFALENFSAVVEYDEFLALPMERLLSYLASDLIDVRTEETVFDAAMKWIYWALDERKLHLGTVMRHVRLATVPVDYLEAVVKTDPLISSQESCRNMVNEAELYHETVSEKHGQRRRSMQSHVIVPRPSTVAKEVLVLIGGVNSTQNCSLQSVEMYDPNKDKWQFLPECPDKVTCYSVCALDNDIYVSGGIREGQVVCSLWKFNPAKRIWTEACPMLTPRARHTSAALNGHLHLLGGIGIQGDGRVFCMESIECYDPLTDSWSTVGETPLPRKQSHAVPYQGTLVEIGGTQAGARVQTMESYICEGTKVTYSGEQFVLPECIQFSQILVLQGIFYIIWEDSKKMISLNPEKRCFRRLADLHYSHVHSGATVLNEKIFVAGGLVDSKPSRVTECYDPVTNSWTLVKSMKQARACHGCVTIQMN